MVAGVAVAKVGDPGDDDRAPLCVVFRGVAPAGEDVSGGEGVAIGFGVGGEGFGHEADFDHRGDAGCDEIVEQAVGDGPVVDGGGVGLFGVDAG